MNGINYNEINFQKLENQQIGLKGAIADKKNEYKDGLTQKECEALDTNKDGFLTEAEFKAAFKDYNSQETYWNAYSKFCNISSKQEKKIEKINGEDVKTNITKVAQTINNELITTFINEHNQVEKVKTETTIENREYDENGVLTKIITQNTDGSYQETIYDTSTGKPVGTLHYDKDKNLESKEIYEYNKYNLKEVIVKKVNIKTDKIEQEIRYYDGEIRQINTYDNEGKCQNKLIYAYNQNDDGTKSVRIKIHGENISAGIQGVITSEIDKDGNFGELKGDTTENLNEIINKRTEYPQALQNTTVIQGNINKVNTVKELDSYYPQSLNTQLRNNFEKATKIQENYNNLLNKFGAESEMGSLLSFLFGFMVEPQLEEIYSDISENIYTLRAKNAQNLENETNEEIKILQKLLDEKYAELENSENTGFILDEIESLILEIRKLKLGLV